MRRANAPLVSVGLPVYNGEQYLAEALGSILAQDYENLEIIISDNASTDRTMEIVTEHAARDPRIRYVRGDDNVGAPANFNRCLELADGHYFMWAADDDLWAPSYITKCVKALESNREAVLACSRVRFIDDAGDPIAMDYTLADNPDLGSPFVVDRVRTLTGRGGWYLIYGLMRRAAVARARPFPGRYGGDVILVMELALQGPFALVPEVLHHYRQLRGRTEADRVAGLGVEVAALKDHWWPGTTLQEGLSDAVAVSLLPWTTKMRVQLEILLQAYVRSTPLSALTHAETPDRVREAIRQRKTRDFAKYSAAWLVGRMARQSWRRPVRFPDLAQRSRKVRKSAFKTVRRSRRRIRRRLFGGSRSRSGSKSGDPATRSDGSQTPATRDPRMLARATMSPRPPSKVRNAASACSP